MSKQRRESALAFVQRLNASPVGLLPPIFQNTTGGGLRQSDVLIVGGAPGSGKTTWAYRVAAQHLSCGGLVTFVFLPGSGNFQMRLFMECLEMFAVTPSSLVFPPPPPLCGYSSSPTAADTSAIEARCEALLGLLGRLEVVHCMDINDFFAYCMNETMNIPSKPVGEAHEAAIPLVIVEGCGGKGSFIHHFERASGHEVPLCYWLLGCLQRQRRCALILVEDWGGTEVTSKGRQYSRSAVEDNSSSLCTLTVEEESGFLSRLQKETMQTKTTFRQNSSKSQRGSTGTAMTSTSTATNNTSSCGEGGGMPATHASATLPSKARMMDIDAHLMGGMRLFYLYTQCVPVPSRGVVVPIGRLLHWRLTEQNTSKENSGNAAEVLTESWRHRRWQKATERTSRLSGEVVCVANL